MGDREIIFHDVHSGKINHRISDLLSVSVEPRSICIYICMYNYIFKTTLSNKLYHPNKLILTLQRTESGSLLFQALSSCLFSTQSFGMGWSMKAQSREAYLSD